MDTFKVFSPQIFILKNFRLRKDCKHSIVTSLDPVIVSILPHLRSFSVYLSYPAT